MPKDRNRKKGKRKVNKRLFIVCEGEKTEPYYFNKFIEECNFRGKPVEVKVVKVKKNTARELVDKAKSLREIPGDEVKNDETIYDSIKERTETAASNAGKVRKYQSGTNPDIEVYELNPYTNVDELLNAIKNLSEIYK